MSSAVGSTDSVTASVVPPSGPVPIAVAVVVAVVAAILVVVLVAAVAMRLLLLLPSSWSWWWCLMFQFCPGEPNTVEVGLLHWFARTLLVAKLKPDRQNPELWQLPQTQNSQVKNIYICIHR